MIYVSFIARGLRATNVRSTLPELNWTDWGASRETILLLKELETRRLLGGFSGMYNIIIIIIIPGTDGGGVVGPLWKFVESAQKTVPFMELSAWIGIGVWMGLDSRMYRYICNGWVADCLPACLPPLAWSNNSLPPPLIYVWLLLSEECLAGVLKRKRNKRQPPQYTAPGWMRMWLTVCLSSYVPSWSEYNIIICSSGVRVNRSIYGAEEETRND